MLGQNLKNGGGRFGGPEAGEVAAGTEFPSYPPLSRTGSSGRDPGELNCNLFIKSNPIPTFPPIFIHF